MKKNVKIAKQLLKIAKELVAGNSYDIDKQLAILTKYPKGTAGDTSVHDSVKEYFQALYTIQNGTFAGFERWVAKKKASVAKIIAKANENIRTIGQLGLTKKEKDELEKAFGFLCDPDFLVPITEGPIKGKNRLQSGPGEINEVYLTDEKGNTLYDANGNPIVDKDNSWENKSVSRPGIDTKTNTVALNAPPEKLSNNSSWLMLIPEGILKLDKMAREMVVSWGNRIIGGTEIGTIDVEGNTDRVNELQNSWTGITDDTIDEVSRLTNVEMKILAKLSSRPQHFFDNISKSMRRLASTLKQNISNTSEEEFDKKQMDVILAIQGWDQRVVGYATVYRQAFSDVLAEYAKLVQLANQSGLNVKVDPNGLALKDGKEFKGSVNRIRNAGLWSTIKNVFKKATDKISSWYKKFTSFKTDSKSDLNKISEKLIDCSMAMEETTQAYENSCKAIRNCIDELEKLANEA